MASADTSVNEYSVEFRIMVPCDDETNPPELIGIKHSFFRHLPDEDSYWWGFNGGDEQEAIYWLDLGEGLEFVLSKLEPQLMTIRRLSEKYRCIWWCGHFHKSFDGGPRLSPDLLLRLSNIGVELFIDTYCDARSAS